MKSILGNFYRHLAIFSGHTGQQHPVRVVSTESARIWLLGYICVFEILWNKVLEKTLFILFSFGKNKNI